MVERYITDDEVGYASSVRRRSFVRALFVIAVFVSTIGGCSLVVDTSGLTGGGGGGSPPTDAAGNDGTRPDVSASDGPANDAPVDVRPDVDPCTGKDICEDFEGALPKAPWLFHENGGATAKIDGVRPHAGSRSLHATREGVKGSGGWMQLSVGAKFDIDCELDVFASGLGANDLVEFATVTHDGAGLSGYESAYVFAKADGFTIGEDIQFTDGGSTQKEGDVPMVGATDRWLHVRVHVTATQSELTITPETGTAATTSIKLTPPTRTTTSLYFGAQYGSGTSGATVFIDDVRCVTK